MNRNIIIRILAVMIFIFGFILIAFTSWWLFTVADIDPPDEYSLWDWDRCRKGGLIWGAWSLVGLALISIGMIVTLLVKTDK